MSHYYIWTIGCQMNQADSQRLASYLESLGYQAAPRMETADLILLNSCVVRQSAENRVLSRLEYLKALKVSRPSLTLGLTGCLVDSNRERLQARFPYLELVFGPQEFEVVQDWAQKQGLAAGDGAILPHHPSPSAYVPIIQGCDSFCTYCVVPYRRGRERSRPVEEVVCEVQEMVRRGVREITLLGQNVDAYGHDLPGSPDLAGLLGQLDGVPGLWRIRFLTSHPLYMKASLIDSVARLDKVCEHINLPVQSGDDGILQAMRRGYSARDYLELIERIRCAIPGVALSTDVIVGFPGESQEQFQHTLNLIKEVGFDTVHVAAYSPRPGTWASRHLRDDVPSGVKKERQRAIEESQEKIATQINSRLAGQTAEILVEGKEKGRWQGRTRTDKLVFFSHAGDWLGRLALVKITETGPWWLQGEVSEVKNHERCNPGNQG